jgi:hypothetical protein
MEFEVFKNGAGSHPRNFGAKSASLPTQKGTGIDQVQQFLRRARIDDRLFVGIDRLEVVNGFGDFLALGRGSGHRTRSSVWAGPW